MKDLSRRFCRNISVALLICGSAGASVLTINFETEPSLPPQPGDFFTAGAMETYSLSGVYTLGGGVVLGNPTGIGSFPAHGSAPNLYATADFADPSLSSTLSLDFPNSSSTVTGVAGILFNGQPDPETYTINYYHGTELLGTAVTPLLEAASSPNSWMEFNVTAPAISTVTITTPNAAVNGWDFLVDDLQLNVIPEVSSVPEPGSMRSAAWGLALLGLCLLSRREFAGKIMRKRVISSGVVECGYKK
jgi:hypothetical protein